MKRFYLLLFALTACVKEFVPPTGNYEDLLVIEAFITDNPSSHVVKLSRSFPINTSQDLPERGATVMLTNADGEQNSFEETSDGMYEVFDLTPEVGMSYRLFVTTIAGDSYESEPVVMKETPGIESIYFEEKTIPSDVEGALETGFQIYTNSVESTGDLYMYYAWEDTWELRTLFQSFLDYNFETNQTFVREQDLSICFRHDESTEIIVGTNEGTNRSNIEKQPLRFVSFVQPMLRERYSILLRQYALSSESYRFWKNLKESNESAGTLYDTQPFQVIGNFRNTSDQNAPVLGYFDMSTEVSKRIFISKDDVPKEVFIPSMYQDCLFGADTVVSPLNTPAFLQNGYLIETSVFPPGSGYRLVQERCIDCRLRGSIERPDFWDE